MPNLTLPTSKGEIQVNVRTALAEDVGGGDLTAQLIDPHRARPGDYPRARDDRGPRLVDEVSARSRIPSAGPGGGGRPASRAGTSRCVPAEVVRALLTGERGALNSSSCFRVPPPAASTRRPGRRHRGGSSTRARPCPACAWRRSTRVTRGCHNHRIGLYDAFPDRKTTSPPAAVIIGQSPKPGAIAPGKPVEVVENLDELRQALEADADIVVLDELSLDDMRTAVALTAGRAKLEASAESTRALLRNIAETGVDTSPSAP